MTQLLVTTLEIKAIFLPSGDQPGYSSHRLECGQRRLSPEPSGFMMYRCGLPPSRAELKRMCFPSGDQVAPQLDCLSLVRLAWPEPSACMIQMSLASNTSAPAARKASRRPSGDQAGETSGPEPWVNWRIAEPSSLLMQTSAFPPDPHARAIRPVPPPFPDARVPVGCAGECAVGAGAGSWLVEPQPTRRISSESKSNTHPKLPFIPVDGKRSWLLSGQMMRSVAGNKRR